LGIIWSITISRRNDVLDIHLKGSEFQAISRYWILEGFMPQEFHWNFTGIVPRIKLELDPESVIPTLIPGEFLGLC
jgi:hypothetical protein